MPHPSTEGTPLRRVLREHALVLVLVASYLVVGLVGELTGVLWGFRSKVVFIGAYLVSLVLAWLPPLLTLIRERWMIRDAAGHRIDGGPGWVAAWRHARQGSLSTDRIVGLLLVVTVLPIFMNTFGAWKASIPELHPFAFDAQLADLDRWLHLGRDPWRWLHPVLGQPAITLATDRMYGLWLFLLPFVVLWQAWNPEPQRRRQFLLTFVLTWIVLGTVCATIWSSAGPCYYGFLVPGPDPFAPLLGYLDQVRETSGLGARDWQDVLWRAYRGSSDHPFTRISAMPSLHVAMPVLYALAAWPRHRWLAVAFAGYALIILIGSVHLGWHYAVDGYVSLALTPVIWWASGRLTRGTTLKATKPNAERIPLTRPLL